MLLAASAQTRVLLDPETFPVKEETAVLQAVADRVAQEVDALIPGPGPGVGGDPIICFEIPPAWQKMGIQAAPLTLHGLKLPGEPTGVRAGTVRIALSSVRPHDRWRLAYQLSHELAHIKMGVLIDNYLIETFAVAVSDEVLRRMGMYGYLLRSEGDEIQALPEPIQRALALELWPEVRDYWQAKRRLQGSRITDRPFQDVGVYLLRGSHKLKWSLLLDVGRLASCPVTTPASVTNVCPPDTDAMTRRGLPMGVFGF